MHTAKTHMTLIGTFGVALLIGLNILVLLHLADDRRIAMHDVEDRAKMVAQSISDDIARRLYGIEQMLLGIDDLLNVLPHAAPFDPSVRAVLESRQRQDASFMDLLVVNPQGSIIHWTGPGDPPSILDRSYVTTHLRHRHSDWFIGPPQLSKVHTGQWFFAISHAFRHADGTLRRIQVVILDLTFLQVRYAPSHEGMLVALTSKQGHSYLPTPTTGPIKLPPSLTDASAPDAPRIFRRASWLDGRLRVIAAAPVTGTPLVALAGIDQEKTLASWFHKSAWILAAWLVGTVFIVGMLRCLFIQQDRLNRLATTDFLSGLNNRGYFMTLGRRLLAQAQRYGQPLSALVLDIDDFKQVNDHYGHACGDLAIQTVADILRRHCRKTDLIGRIGGEEFVMLLTGTSMQGALATARKVLSEVETTPVSDAFSITVSIGVSSLRPGDVELESLIRRADQAMYHAKQSGKNRVRHLDPST